MYTKYDWLHLAIFSINIMYCYSYVNYELFKGFDSNTNDITVQANDTYTVLANDTYTVLANDTSLNTDENLNETMDTTPVFANSSTLPPKKSSVKLKDFYKSCPETAFSTSLGSYVIPTYRDLVLFTKRTLVKMFNSYQEKTLFLLKDIKEATAATSVYKKKCLPQNRDSYKKCVTLVSKKCISIVKDLVASKELQKGAVAPLLQGTTCNMTSLDVDPIQLIKILAMDEASLEFALPAFLRLIDGCSAHCSRQLKDGRSIRRPIRHMSDQDLVIKHFLTNKTYIQLIMDS